MTAQELRQKYLDFFSAQGGSASGGKGHTIIPSASLIPENDPSVLFTTAGMHPFKEFYLNPDKSENSRVATIQKCVRTIDIDEVGDKTHLTFFEMLGNFSFGYPDKQNSYFKEETINYAWEFLTENLEIDKKRIYATYFKGQNGIAEDAESLNILKKIKGLSKIIPQGFEDNFWSLSAENSPGGPTVEFYVDDIEVWNCVFNEYVLKGGKYEPADKKGVDTGMGFERLLAVLDGKETVFEIELFQPLFEKMGSMIPRKVNEKGSWYENLNEKEKKSARIVGDHIKASVFIIADGVTPSNIGSGYVLRKLIRRSIRHAKLLRLSRNFTESLAHVVIYNYGEFYPELKNNSDKIIEELKKEEDKFRRTLENGLKILEKDLNAVEFKPGMKLSDYIIYDIEGMPGYTPYEIVGTWLFNFYQNLGFPPELIFEELRRRNRYVSEEEEAMAIKEFQSLFKKHQELSRTDSAGMFKGGLADSGEKTTKLHTAAHLMLAALRQVLGTEVLQRGSNITEERLRFDFSHNAKLTSEQITEVEKIVNEQIHKKLPVICEEMTLEEAKKQNAMGIFESKYGEKVKVYKIGEISNEICGGPHVQNTSELGKFKIKKEESSSAGVRRIKAILE